MKSWNKIFCRRLNFVCYHEKRWQVGKIATKMLPNTIEFLNNSYIIIFEEGGYVSSISFLILCIWQMIGLGGSYLASRRHEKVLF